MTSKTTRYNDLAEKHIFITGGATGIGAELVRAFSEQRAKVSFIDIDEANAAKLCAEVHSTRGSDPWFRKIDVTNIAALQQAMEAAIKSHGAIYCLINNVANDARHSAEDMDEERWRQSLAVNLDAAFFASKKAYASMKQEKQGSIINFSSINIVLGSANMPAYVTAKAAIIGMTKSLARAYGGDGIRVNSIMPGWVATDRQLDMLLTPEEEEKWRELVAIKERLQPADIAKLTLFLASMDSRMITGQKFVIDAGRT